jgi:sensor c-di-GMP phosphodiesterase-like protein
VLPTRKLLIAIAIGVSLSGPPMVVLNLWMDSIVQRQIREDVEVPARRHLSIVEARIASTIKTLDELVSLGIDSCGPSDIDALRQATLASVAVKEFSIVSAKGQTLCSSIDGLSDQRHAISSEPVTPDSRVRIEIVQIGANGAQGPSWVRLHRPRPQGANGIAALIPVALFVPQVLNAVQLAGPVNFHAQIRSGQGVVLATAGAMTPDIIKGDSVTTQQRSNRFAIQIVVTASRASLLQERDELQMLVLAVNVLPIILMFAIIILNLWRQRDRNNPMAEIERALAAGEFVPYYQPIVDIRSGRLRGAEVLIRWRKPDGTIVPPGLFIPLAETSGIIVDLTRALMRKVCSEIGTELGKRPNLSIAFNVTARHLAGEDIVDDLRAIFKRSKIRFSQITLELTENYPIESLTETRRVVAAIQGLGCKVAIDDVGTGHSGLSYLLKLGVDIIKIDKLFIDSIGIDRNSAAIVETLIDLALNMRIDVVAEGVETFEQVEQLREMGVRAAQGYVFAPPLPGPSFLKLLEAVAPPKDSGLNQAENGVPNEAHRPIVASAS